MNAPVETTTTRAWFREQIAVVPSHHDVVLNGTSIHYRSWGSGEAQIVLVHGGAANSAW
jgi:hypothetical protein